MTPSRDEVIRMAREAGMSFEVFPDGYCDAVDVPRGTVSYIDCVSFEYIERFAALVAERATEEANRKANASWKLMCEKMVAAERDACAQTVEGAPWPTWAEQGDERDVFAAAIRARGQEGGAAC